MTPVLVCVQCSVRRIRALPALATAICCSTGAPNAPIDTAPATIVVTPSSISFAQLGATQQLTATVLNASGAQLTAQVSWSSDDPGVVSISSSTGVAQAIGNGQTVVRAQAGLSIGTAIASVQSEPTLVGLALSAVAPAVEVTGGLKIVATRTLSDGSTSTQGLVTYSTSDPSLATITQAGILTGVRIGRVTVTASAEGHTAFLAINVRQNAGTYALESVSSHLLPVNFESQSCVQPPLTVCSIREWITGATLVLTPGALASLVVRYRTDITTASGTSSAVSTDEWEGTWLHSGTSSVAFSLAHVPIGSIKPVFPTGNFQSDGVDIPFEYSGTVRASHFSRMQ